VVVALFDETGSVVPEFASAVLTIVVPAATLPPTVTTYVKFPLDVVVAMLAIVQSTSPVAPTAGAVPQAHPAGGVIEANVVFGGVC
jgi:hypothetical protein